MLAVGAVTLALLEASGCGGRGATDEDAGARLDAAMDAREEGGAECGSLGRACINAAEDCAPDQRCDGTGAGPVCIPDRAGCGGFLPDECPTEAPVCIYCAGCDFGACFTAPEAACLCGTAERADAFDCP
jgi:hypothetical protein